MINRGDLVGKRLLIHSLSTEAASVYNVNSIRAIENVGADRRPTAQVKKPTFISVIALQLNYHSKSDQSMSPPRRDNINARIISLEHWEAVAVDWMGQVRGIVSDPILEHVRRWNLNSREMIWDGYDDIDYQSVGTSYTYLGYGLKKTP